MIPSLTTARLTLRGPKDSDAAALGAFLESPRAAWIGGPWPASDAPDWLAHCHAQWAVRGRGQWIVALRLDDTPIGRVGLLDHTDWPEPELAWLLFADFEAQGYAHEAATAARAHANGPLGLPALFSFIEPTNERSRRLAERLGAHHERDVRFQDLDFQVFRHPLGAAA